MNDPHFLSLAWTQLTQVSVLIAVVWLLVKLFARQRPHLAYALWLVVLIKCVTPPVMSSPTGVMSHLVIPKPAWLTFESAVEVEEERTEPKLVDLAPELPPDPLPLQVSEANFEVDDLSRGFVIDEDELPPEFFGETEFDEQFLAADETPPVIEPEILEEPATAAAPVSARLWKIWLGSAGCVLLVTFARVLITLRRVYRNRVETPAQLADLVSRLSVKLRLRRKVSVLVTAAKVGPAVVGFFRPLLILPQVVTQGRSPRELEPIIAHELLHVKRGDLGVGWLQVLVQSLWWFHPLVWLVNRFLSREAERCCDEAVVAELDCPPSRYARCLLNVLEQKRNLTPIPACPGVKPVELTKQRMERIMKLGQGCRKRSPWWCWLVVVLLGVVVLPGRGETEAEESKPDVKFHLKEANSTKVTIEKLKVGQPAASPELSPRTYQIGRVLERLQKDYQIGEEDAQTWIELQIEQTLRSMDSPPGGLTAGRLGSKCLVRGDSLEVRANEEIHQIVRKLVRLWRNVGFYYVRLETIIAQGSVELSADRLRGWNQGMTALTSVLTEQQRQEFIDQLRGDARSDILSRPKLLLVNGQGQVVSQEVFRPFVTDVKDDEQVIEIFPDGMRLMLSPAADADGNVHLEYQLRLSEISGVDTRKVKGNDGRPEATVQIPDVRHTHLRSSIDLKEGETALIAGVKTQDSEDNENEFYVLIKPTLEKIERSTFTALIEAQRNPNLSARGSRRSTETPPILLRLSGQKCFLTSNGEPVTASPILKGIVFDLREQKGLYQSAHDELVKQLRQSREVEFFDDLTDKSLQFQKLPSADVSLQDLLLAINQQAGTTFIVNTDELSKAGLSLKTTVNLESNDRRLQTLLTFLKYELGYCTLPVAFADRLGKISPLVYLSTREDIIDVSLALRAQSIPVVCFPDDLEWDSPARKKVLDVLSQPLNRDFQQTKLIEFSSYLNRTKGINIIFAPEANEMMTTVDIEYQAGTIPLGQVLKEACEPNGMTFYVDQEEPWIKATKDYQNQIITVAYWLGDIMPPNLQLGPNARQTVIDYVKQTFAPESWQDSREFRIVPVEGDAAFLIRQRRKVHEQIRDQAAKKMSGTGVNSDSGVIGSVVLNERNFDIQTEPISEKHTRPRNKYDREITFRFEDVPLKQAIEEICELGDLKVDYDEDELAEEGVALTTPVTYSATNEVALRALSEMLKPLKLELDMAPEPVDQNGEQGVKITIRPTAVIDRIQVTIAYPIGDLLEKDKSLQGVVGVPILDKVPHQNRLFQAKPRTKSQRADALIDVLEKALAWDKTEADETTGIIKFSERTEALVIRCNRAQHDLIAKLLCERRRACGIEVKPTTSDDDETASGPGPGVMPRQFPNPVAAEQIDTVQLQFSAARESLYIHEPVYGPDREYKLKLPGRHDIAPEKRYFLALGNNMRARNHEINATEASAWILEIPKWNARSKAYLSRNAIPLQFTDEDLDQVASNKSVTKVVYLPHPKNEELALDGIETLVSTRLDAGVDPIAEAKSRGTILAVLKSVRGRQMRGVGVDSDSGVTGDVVVDQPESAPPKSAEDVPLEMLLKYYEKVMKTDVKIASGALEKAGIKKNHPVTLSVYNGEDPQESLSRNLKPLGLICESRTAEVLEGSKTVTRNYMVIMHATQKPKPKSGSPFYEKPAAEPPPPVKLPRIWNDLKDARPTAKPPKPAEAKLNQRPIEDRLLTISYPVADLVVPYADVVTPFTRDNTDEAGDEALKFQDPKHGTASRAGELSTPAPVVQSTDGTKTAMKQNLNSLAELIKKSVETDREWNSEEAENLLTFAEPKMMLVIRARQSTHKEIQEMLADLRRKQDLQVTLECLTVQFEKDSFADFRTNVGIDFETVDSAPKNSKDPLILYCVKNDDFRNKVKRFEKSEILSFPKMMVFNGVGAQIQISRDEADERQAKNMHYMIVPTASEDRRTVDIKFAVNPTNRLDVLSKSKSMTVPDGETVFIEVTDELLSSPKATGVPGIDNALRELKKKELGVRTFVLLTPRIIIQEEEEALLMGPVEQDGK
jgi:beta-lactamase regulating signal transducer with metallopeptidase domain